MAKMAGSIWEVARQGRGEQFSRILGSAGAGERFSRISGTAVKHFKAHQLLHVHPKGHFLDAIYFLHHVFKNEEKLSPV